MARFVYQWYFVVCFCSIWKPVSSFCAKGIGLLVIRLVDKVNKPTRKKWFHVVCLINFEHIWNNCFSFWLRLLLGISGKPFPIFLSLQTNINWIRLTDFWSSFNLRPISFRRFEACSDNGKPKVDVSRWVSKQIANLNKSKPFLCQTGKKDADGRTLTDEPKIKCHG